jgi:hypothetical protein
MLGAFLTPQFISSLLKTLRYLKTLFHQNIQSLDYESGLSPVGIVNASYNWSGVLHSRLRRPRSRPNQTPSSGKADSKTQPKEVCVNAS